MLVQSSIGIDGFPEQSGGSSCLLGAIGFAQQLRRQLERRIAFDARIEFDRVEREARRWVQGALIEMCAELGAAEWWRVRELVAHER